MILSRTGRAAVRFSHRLPVARVSYRDLDGALPASSLTQSTSVASLPPSAIFSIIRTFADRPVGRPKQHTGRATARKTTSEAAAAKKTTTKAKAKAKPKPKPKPKTKTKTKAKAKKIKTPEQIEAAKARKSKQAAAENLKNLKAASLKDEEPKHGRITAFIAFFTSVQKGSHSSLTDTASTARKAAADYRELSPADREAWNHRANATTQARTEKYRSWVEGKDPATIDSANRARKKLKALGARGFKHVESIKDHRAVKRPANAYSRFLRERFASSDFRGVKVTDAAKLISQEWKDLPSSEKQRLTDEHKEDQARYEREFRATFGRDP